jgi:hypothetical protein
MTEASASYSCICQGTTVTSSIECESFTHPLVATAFVVFPAWKAAAALLATVITVVIIISFTLLATVIFVIPTNDLVFMWVQALVPVLW